MKRRLSVVAAGILASCAQNPYPETGRFFVKEPPMVTPAPVADIEMPATLDCEENGTCEASLRGVFGAGGTPVLSFETLPIGARATIAGLPAGASFDPKTEMLTYSPGFDTVDIARDPSHPVGVVQIQVTLRKAEDPLTIYKKKNLLVVVRNVLRPVDLQLGRDPLRVTEGETLSKKLVVSSPDFPQGPFQLVVRGAPMGFSAEAINGSEYQLTYAPGYGTVTYNDTIDPQTGAYQKQHALEFQIYLPSGEMFTIPGSLIVLDRRLSPIVSAPAEVSQGPVINFMVRVDDLNGERPPVVRLPTSMPYGRLQISELPLSTPGVMARLFDIKWDNIPLSEQGKQARFSYLVCSPTSATDETQCKTHTTLVNIIKAGQE